MMTTVPMTVIESLMMVSTPWTTMSSTVLTSLEMRDMISPVRRASKNDSDCLSRWR